VTPHERRDKHLILGGQLRQRRELERTSTATPVSTIRTRSIATFAVPISLMSSCQSVAMLIIKPA